MEPLFGAKSMPKVDERAVSKRDVKEVLAMYTKLRDERPGDYQRNILDLQSLVLAFDVRDEGDVHDEILGQYPGWERHDFERLLDALGEAYDQLATDESPEDRREQQERKLASVAAAKAFRDKEIEEARTNIQKHRADIVALRLERAQLPRVTEEQCAIIVATKEQSLRAKYTEELKSAERSYQDYQDNYYKSQSIWEKFKNRSYNKEQFDERKGRIVEVREELAELGTDVWKKREMSIAAQELDEQVQALDQKLAQVELALKKAEQQLVRNG